MHESAFLKAAIAHGIRNEQLLAINRRAARKELPGGDPKSAGRLFKRSVKMYVYPTRDPVSGQVQSLEEETVSPPWHHLRDLQIETGHVEQIRGYDVSYLSIRTPDVLARIERGDPSWEQMVPGTVEEIIRAKKLFGWQPAHGPVVS